MTQSMSERVNDVDGVVRQAQAVLAVTRQAYIAVSTVGRVRGWNPAAERIFGYTPAQTGDRDIADLIIPARFRDAHRAGLARLAAAEPGRVLGQQMQLIALHRDGHEFPIEMTLTVTEEPGGRTFHAFCHDVTTARRAARFADVEAAIALGLAEADSSTVAAYRVVEALGEKMGWPVVELWLVDDHRQMLTCASRHTAAGRQLGHFALDELELGVALPGGVCADGTSRWIADLSADIGSLRSGAAARIGLHVAVGVPLSVGGHTLGALCVYGDRVEDPEDTLLGLLSGLAAHVGQYLERRRAEELTIELARTKDEFLAMVTHELRNPLAVISSTVELFDEELDELSTEQQRENLHIIARSSQRLTVMAEDLLDLSRLESGQLAVNPVDTDLCTLIDESVQANTAPALVKQLTVSVQLPERLTLHADPTRLRQVADNLLSNAIKYTPAGGTITIIAGFDDTGQTITWTVADTGIGVPADERPRLFHRFYRASTALNKRIPGTGLGLVITRSIVERHHGTITLADNTGPGTTFVVRLPTIELTACAGNTREGDIVPRPESAPINVLGEAAFSHLNLAAGGEAAARDPLQSLSFVNQYRSKFFYLVRSAPRPWAHRHIDVYRDRVGDHLRAGASCSRFWWSTMSRTCVTCCAGSSSEQVMRSRTPVTAPPHCKQ
ncbi:ATP-binding protein [Micromonosporaceae bacterium Da 78-11]